MLGWKEEIVRMRRMHARETSGANHIGSGLLFQVSLGLQLREHA
jgi:hypothetical protein